MVCLLCAASCGYWYLSTFLSISLLSSLFPILSLSPPLPFLESAQQVTFLDLTRACATRFIIFIFNTNDLTEGREGEREVKRGRGRGREQRVSRQRCLTLPTVLGPPINQMTTMIVFGTFFPHLARCEVIYVCVHECVYICTYVRECVCLSACVCQPQNVVLIAAAFRFLIHVVQDFYRVFSLTYCGIVLLLLLLPLLLHLSLPSPASSSCCCCCCF